MKFRELFMLTSLKKMPHFDESIFMFYLFLSGNFQFVIELETMGLQTTVS